MNQIMRKHRIMRQRQRQGGLTLIEIMLVLVILMMVMGAVIVYVLPRQSEAQISTTRLRLARIDQNIQMYTLHIGRPPTEDEGLRALVSRPAFDNEALSARWQGAYVDPDEDFIDPWGNPFRYEVVDADTNADAQGRGYRLYSMGPDGQPDTDDDIYARRRTDSANDI